MSVDRPEDPYTGHLFESSAFPEILHEASASAGNLIDQDLVSRQPEMGYTEDYLCFQEGQNMDDYLKPQSEEIAVRQTDIIDIDSLESENMRVEQDNDPIIGLVKRWKISGRKPIWQDVASHGLELKNYWGQWESLLLINDILHRKSEKPYRPGEIFHQILLPDSLRKTAFALTLSSDCRSFRSAENF